MVLYFLCRLYKEYLVKVDAIAFILVIFVLILQIIIEVYHFLHSLVQLIFLVTESQFVPRVLQLANLSFHLVIDHRHFIGLKVVFFCDVFKTLLKFPLVFLQENALVFKALKFPFIVFAFTAIPLIILLLLIKIIIQLRRNFLELILHFGIVLLDFP